MEKEIKNLENSQAEKVSGGLNSKKILEDYKKHLPKCPKCGGDDV